MTIDGAYQEKSVSPTIEQQTITADDGYDALSSVSIGAVTNAIDSNIQANNIKKDITILGVTGTFEGGQSTRCPISLAQNVVPQSAVGVVDLSWADLSYTRSLSRAFYYCRDITEVYFGNQSMNVTNGANCFIGCNKLISIVGSRNIITNTCTDLQYFFYDCDKLQYVDVSDWDTSNVLTFTQCFRNCKKLEYLDLRSWRLDSATSLNLMFNATQMLSTIRVGEGWTKGVELTSTGLTHDGILQFFNDLPTISDAQTITLGATKLGYMSDAEKAIAQNKGWTLS